MSRKSVKEYAPEVVATYDAIVVGGGPAGLAAALGLRETGRFARIALIERSDRLTSADADKSFTYLVDGRGLATLKRVGVSADALDASGTRNSAMKTTILKPQGTRRTLTMPGQSEKRRNSSWWIARSSLMRELEKQLKTERRSTIDVITSATCSDLEFPSAASDSTAVTLHLDIHGGAEKRSLRAPFVIGADGIQSRVRTRLREFLGEAGSAFEPVRLSSPSAGLRFKVLRLPPSFETAKEGGSPAEPHLHYVFAPSPRAKKKAFRLSSFPVGTPETPRTAITIAQEDHPLWKIRDGEELLRTLRDLFPQAPIDVLVSKEEAERFAKAEGGRFPQPQYVRQLGHVFTGHSAHAAIALVGDAIHCFPPDSGQGVNAALEDVSQLLDALSSAGSLEEVIRRYQRRARDVEGLGHIAATAAPYQYGQDSAGMRRWAVRTLTRVALHKIAPRSFDLPGFLLVQDAELSYGEMWERARNPVHLPKSPRLSRWLTTKLAEGESYL